jgi:predicted secreted protein
MSCFQGNAGVVSIGGSTVAQVRSYTITESSDTAECSAMGDSYRTHVATLKSWEGSLDLVWAKQDGDITVGGSAVALIVYPEGTGDNMAGSIIITGMDVTASYDDIVQATVSFTGTGTLTRTYA